MLRKFEGFNLAPSYSDLQGWWTYVTNGGSAAINPNKARRSPSISSAAVLVDPGDGVGQLFDSQATWIVGVAIKPESFGDSAPLIKFNTAAGEQISLRISPTQYLYVSRNGTTLWLGSLAMHKIPLNVYTYLEFKATINTSSGSWSLRVNGLDSTLVSQTGANTAGQGGTTADRVYVQRPTTASADFSITDIYICDGQASDGRNTMLGVMRMDLLSATSDGAQDGQFSVTGDANAWGAVDDWSDSDTSYIASNVVGDKQTLGVANLIHLPSAVHGIAIASYAKKSDGGTREFKHLLRTASSNYQGALHAPTISYAAYRDDWHLNPSNSSQFSALDINNIEIGAEIVT